MISSQFANPKLVENGFGQIAWLRGDDWIGIAMAVVVTVPR